MADRAEADMAILRQHVSALAEHFDTVQVFCTRHDMAAGGEGGTVNCHLGSGNWFARFGHVRMWLNAEEAQASLNSRSADSREDWEK